MELVATKQKRLYIGHLMAVFTVFIWGITFISSKILLRAFPPMSIIVIRFTLAYLLLYIFYPKIYKVSNLRQEVGYLFAGLTGVSLYFLLETEALVYTTVSNTGLILATAPLFVAIVNHLFTKDEKLHLNLIIGFFIAMIGIGVVVFNGQVYLKVNPIGDLLALLGAICWAFYSLRIKKTDRQVHPILFTRRIFFYGVISGLLFAVLLGERIEFRNLAVSNYWMHFLFLGGIASSLCFVLWNQSIQRIGAIRTSNYIYIMPIFTLIGSVVILQEKVTGLMVGGCFLILLGTYISERGFKWKGQVK